MTRLIRLSAGIALTASLLLLPGCKQGVNERCQVQSDCDDGLICVLPPSATPQSGGTCQMPSSGTPADLGIDMAAPAGSDLSGTGADLVSSGD